MVNTTKEAMQKRAAQIVNVPEVKQANEAFVRIVSQFGDRISVIEREALLRAFNEAVTEIAAATLSVELGA